MATRVYTNGIKHIQLPPGPQSINVECLPGTRLRAGLYLQGPGRLLGDEVDDSGWLLNRAGKKSTSEVITVHAVFISGKLRS